MLAGAERDRDRAVTVGEAAPGRLIAAAVEAPGAVTPVDLRREEVPSQVEVEVPVEIEVDQAGSPGRYAFRTLRPAV